MKKRILIALCVFVVLASVGLLVFRLWESGVFIFERTADVSLNRVIWNGKEYSPVSGEYTEGRTIAKGEGDWVVNAVKEDSAHTFIVARSFLDQQLMVLDGYTVPTAGELTTVCWNGNYITDASFLKAVSKIETKKITDFTYETEGIFQLTDTQHMRALYFAYENCPVATNYIGYMGKVNGKWVITTDISADKTNADGLPKTNTVGCYVIPAEYHDILTKYFD